MILRWDLEAVAVDRADKDRASVWANFAPSNDLLRLYVDPDLSQPKPLFADAVLGSFDLGSISYIGINSFSRPDPYALTTESSFGQIRMDRPLWNFRFLSRASPLQDCRSRPSSVSGSDTSSDVSANSASGCTHNESGIQVGWMPLRLPGFR